MVRVRPWFIILVLILVGCALTPTTTSSSPTPAVSPSPSVYPTPFVSTTSTPDVQAAAHVFLTAWQADQYDTMYSLLSRLSQDGISKEIFTNRYRDTAINLSLQKLDFEILSSLVTVKTGQVAYRVTFHTALVGDIKRDMVMNFGLDNGQWRVQWEEGMIMPDLRGGNRLSMDINVPGRGNIYDRNNNAVVAQSDAVALGIIPGNIGEDHEGDVLRMLSELTGKTPLAIKALYKGAAPLWYIPVGEATLQAVNERYGTLTALGGIVMNNFRTRYYYDGGISPQAVGYTLGISAEQLEEYRRKGYRGDERVGSAGLEKWGEEKLTGKRGASLYVIDPKGQIVTRLAQTSSQPSESIYMTLDKNFQLQVQKALEGFRGAIVVLERDTGRVLAMASSPSFDPNLFEPTNYNSKFALGEVFNANEQRLINRATQGLYPLGSLFKIVTMSAALESGLYKADTTYYCGSYFTEIPGLTLKDWTVDKEYPPSGLLNLQEGLMRSCNPYFWHIGLDLYRKKGNKAVSDMARGFGLGSATGIGQVAENSGNMPDAANEGDALQLAIGQGTMLVTPLQVASYVAAVGNGGTLYRPQLVEKVAGSDGKASLEFKPEERAKLPISQANLKTLQEAMRMVVANRRGTAFQYFTGLDIPVYGKTGTAQNSAGKAHAWFGGYTALQQPGKPDIAIAVVAENAGEGSDIAAPIFRRVVELYFSGKPLRIYPWESTYYVTRTATPLVSPTPEGTPKP